MTLRTHGADKVVQDETEGNGANEEGIRERTGDEYGVGIRKSIDSLTASRSRFAHVSV